MLFKLSGIAFHNFGPWTAKELSNRVWLAAELVLLLDGRITKVPSLGRETNWTLRSLPVCPCKIFHMCRRMKRSLILCRDMRDKLIS